MFAESLMRWLLILVLLLLTISLASCSYSTDFVVLNDANHAIQVVYKVKPQGPPTLAIEPMVVSASNLETRDKSEWKKLAPDRFCVDQVDRTVTVTLSPHEALWVTTMPHYIGDKDPNDVKNFPIEEVSVAGAGGEMRFTGDKARKAFERKSRVLYVLSYF